MSADTTTKPAFDRQGDQSDEARVDAAARVRIEFGITAAVHLESCVKCGLCAEACHFYRTTGDPKYTPIHKLEPFRRAYFREASSLAPLVRKLGLIRTPTIRDLEQWQELLYDSCTMCGRCTLICPMGIDIAELVKEARHGMFVAGLVPERLALMDRAARQWGSLRRPARISRTSSTKCQETVAWRSPATSNTPTSSSPRRQPSYPEHTKAMAAAAKILNRTGERWTMHQGGFDASNIGFNNGDLELQEKLTRALVDTAVKIGAKTVLLPECGHAYGAALGSRQVWYGSALPVRIIH
ncbi:MAG: (Fe-S)-binding protein [Betaproteobacteria bacterium]|nr:(Fe-S)-binding protein [Betaproteobacteria bacterium]